MRDEIIIYRSGKEWRWKRVAKNGRIVGASSEGYRSFARCLGNARRCCELPKLWSTRR